MGGRPDLSALVHLEQVDLSFNALTKFPPGLASLPALAALDLSGNQLHSLILPASGGIRTRLEHLKFAGECHQLPLRRSSAHQRAFLACHARISL